MAFEHMGSAAFAVTTPGQPFDGQVNPLLEKPYDHQEGDMEHRRYNLFQRAVASFETGPASHQLVLQGDASEKVSQGRSYFAPISAPEWLPENGPHGIRSTASQRQ